ncbi:hypothetical protein [Terrabacter aerolatus]|uniref:hypothetical protein n=1 Tax=Terrabacter aerolatus TaxID=422442 RepID=UPI0011BFAC7E|nr:hypothetical protein [Terrabacter aerolatus]
MHRRSNRAGRSAAVAVISTVLLLLAGPAFAIAPAGADKSNARALTTTTASLSPGQSGWVSVVWTADQTVTDWSTTVSAPKGVTVTYPTTRGGADTSLYGSDTLVGTTRDFTSFKLKVPYTQTTSFQVVLTSRYSVGVGNSANGNGNGNAGNNGNGNGNSGSFTTTATVTVPVQAASGPTFTQQTTSLAIKAGSSGFERIAFTGGQADLTDFSVRLGDLPAGLEVAYPGDRASAGLNGDQTLVGGSADYVGVRFIATDLRPGTYSIPVLISYTAAAPQTRTASLTLNVS